MCKLQSLTPIKDYQSKDSEHLISPGQTFKRKSIKKTKKICKPLFKIEKVRKAETKKSLCTILEELSQGQSTQESSV